MARFSMILGIFVFVVIVVSLADSAVALKRADWTSFIYSKDKSETGSIGLAPESAIVNANRCDTDGVCEIKSLKVEDGNTRLYTDNEKVEVVGSFWMRSSIDFLSYATPSGEPPLARIALDGLQGGAALSILSYAGRNIKLITERDGGVIVTSLSGKGEGYVCVDNNGKLYHSLKACV